MGNKKKGIAAERELLHLLWDNKFACCRVAGSGSIPEPSCDLLAGNCDNKYAIEVKTSRKEKKYFDKNQVFEFKKFADRFGLTPVIAIKFLRAGWFFIFPKNLEKTSKGFAVSLEKARLKNIGLIENEVSQKTNF